MAEDPPEIRSWLTDVLSRRVRRPALEETIFHQLDELERGPLEQLAALVHTAIDELRIARRRLDDQARQVHVLQATVAQLTERVDELGRAAGPEEEPVTGHVLMLATAEGYRLADGGGPAPEPGAELELDGVAYRVLNRRRSPYPGDRRSCALLLPLEPTPPSITPMNVSLRPIEASDLDAIYRQTTDPESIRMAAFTAENQTDRRAFVERMARVRADTTAWNRVIEVDGAVAGTIACFRVDDRREVTYWVDREKWGKGIASAALQLLLAEVAERPLYARAASDNVGSLRVLEKAGFRRIGVDRGFAPGRGEEIEETILRLD